MSEKCPCGFGDSYDACCGVFHRGAPAPTAERLMRSRYAAFAVGDEAYLLRTWHSTTRPSGSLNLDPQTRWLRLIVETSHAGSPFDATGEVTFTAIARTIEGRFVQRERSRFVREADALGQSRWYYIDGDALEA